MTAETAAPIPAQEKVGVVVIHGVGETEPGWINDYLVPELEKRTDGLVFSRRSEVYRLADAGRTAPNQHFNAFVRRARLSGNREVAFIELFWADLSRVGNNIVSRFIALMRLFYEAPLVLGHAFLPSGQKGGLALLRWVILAANWLLRWPLTGINTAMLLCALVVLAMRTLMTSGWLPFMTVNDYAYPLMAILVLLSAGALAFGNWRLHRDIALADVGFSTAIMSALLLAALIVEQVWTTGAQQGTKRFTEFEYLHLAGELFIFTAFVWTHVVTAGILVFLALLAWRLIGRSPIPLSRPAAALGLTALQAVVWKIAISSLWFLIVAAVLAPYVNDPDVTSRRAYEVLSQRQYDLFHVVVFNVGMLIVILLALVLVIWTRVGTRMIWRSRVMRQRLELPRVIVSPVLIIVIFGLTLFNYYSFFGGKLLAFMTDSCTAGQSLMLGFYGPLGAKLIEWRNAVLGLLDWNGLCGKPMSLPFDPYQWANQIITGKEKPSHKDVLAVLGTAVGGSAITYLFAYFRLANRLQEASSGALHIARDIVDHQYTPRFGGLNRVLMRSKRQRGYPRRDRIRRRLDEVMNEVVAAEDFNRIVFVAHSQGTVILLDYLRSGSSTRTLATASRIDIVTLGSPLGHLYQHYFRSYDVTVPDATALDPKLASWINFWRIDDPIGHRVELIGGGFIRNETLAKGGHTNYWREIRVCRAVLDLIDPELCRRKDEPGEDGGGKTRG